MSEDKDDHSEPWGKGVGPDNSGFEYSYLGSFQKQASGKRSRTIRLIAAAVIAVALAARSDAQEVESASEPVATVPPTSDLDSELRAGTERKLDLGGGVHLELVWIPPGEFMMGSSLSASEVQSKYGDDELTMEAFWQDEHPRHKVGISQGFWLGRTEVTVGQFRKFVEATGHRTDAEKAGSSGGFVSGEGWKDVDGLNWKNPGWEMPVGEDYPVVHVSWNDAVAFCKWLGSDYRLPTEAEWEYACRAGTTTVFPWGNDADGGKGWLNGADQTKIPNGTSWSSKFNFEDGYWSMAPVGRFRANRWGLHDMLGNVYEWCADWYGTYPSGSVTDPTGPSNGSDRVLRGGSWHFEPRLCRSAYRSWYSPEYRYDYLGFRVALPASSVD